MKSQKLSHSIGVILFFSLSMIVNVIFAQSLRVDTISPTGGIKYIIQDSDKEVIIIVDSNGVIDSYIPSMDRKVHGLALNFYDNGGLNYVSKYYNGRKVDTSYSFYENGDTLGVGICDEGVCFVQEFYHNGHLKSEYKTTDEGFMIGVFRNYCENGAISLELDYSKEFQNYLEYDCDGRIIRKGEIYESVHWIGIWEEYWPETEVLKERGYYSIDKGKVGIWKYYKINGEIDRIEDYR